MLWNWIVTFPWIPALYTGIFSTGFCLWVEVQFLVCSFYDNETLNFKKFFLVFPTCAFLIHEILLYKALFIWDTKSHAIISREVYFFTGRHLRDLNH
jgi:hypothetical protein